MLSERGAARGAVDAVALDTGGFRFGKVLDLQSPDFLPGGARYGDLPGMLALGKPRRLWLAGEAVPPPTLVHQAYAVAGEAGALTVVTGERTQIPAGIQQWLLALAGP